MGFNPLRLEIPQNPSVISLLASVNPFLLLTIRHITQKVRNQRRQESMGIMAEDELVILAGFEGHIQFKPFFQICSGGESARVLCSCENHNPKVLFIIKPFNCFLCLMS